MFELPRFPDHDSGSTRGLVRIVDPDGLAVAWFDPGSARCVEFMVRSGDRGQTTWVPVFAVPDAQGTDWCGTGCEVFAAAGDAVIPIMSGASASDWPGAEWRLLQRDPTSVSLNTTLYGEVDALSGLLDVRLIAQLEDATLSLAMTVQNVGRAAAPVAFGLRAYFPPGLVHDSRLLVARAEDEPAPLRLPASRDADGCAATMERSQEERITPEACTASRVATRVVVACDESARRIESLRDDRFGNVGVAFLGPSVQLEPGICTGLAVSMECW